MVRLIILCLKFHLREKLLHILARLSHSYQRPKATDYPGSGGKDQSGFRFLPHSWIVLCSKPTRNVAVVFLPRAERKQVTGTECF